MKHLALLLLGLGVILLTSCQGLTEPTSAAEAAAEAACLRDLAQTGVEP